MSLNVLTHGEVISKWTNEGTNKDGKPVTFYNLKLGDRATFQQQNLSVSEDIYNVAEEGKELALVGKVGGFGNERWWYFNELYKKN